MGERIITPADGATGKTLVLDGAMRCPNEDGKGCTTYQEEVLDVLNATKTHPHDIKKQRELAKVCWSRRTAVNVADTPCKPGRFDPEEFSVEACQKVVLDAGRSRASAQNGTKVFSTGPGAFLASGWSHSVGAGQSVVAKPVGPHVVFSE